MAAEACGVGCNDLGMRIRILGGLCVLAVALPISVGSQPNVCLLRPGTFLIDAPRVQASEQWFGVRQTRNAWDLVRVSPRIAPSDKPTCGDRATRITVDAVGEVLFLISGVRNLSPGPITTAIASPRLLYPGESVDISVQRGDDYVLEALGSAAREPGGVILLDYALWVCRGQRAQAIATFERNSLDNPRQIVWAGDLDRDLRPDLLFDFPLGDAGESYELFLSSAATGDQLAARVAAFSTPGC